jgi:hypothetical protein
MKNDPKMNGQRDCVTWKNVLGVTPDAFTWSSVIIHDESPGAPQCKDASAIGGASACAVFNTPTKGAAINSAAKTARDE